MKNQLKKVIPNSWLKRIRRLRQSRLVKKIQLLFLVKGDYVRFCTSAFGLRKHLTYGNLISAITFHAHSIEKGLSHQDIRFGFGKRALFGLFSALEAYQKGGYPVDDLRFQAGLSVINEYIKLHDAHHFVIEDTKKNFAQYLPLFTMPLGGTVEMCKNDILASTQGAFSDLVMSRFSTRDYSDLPVDEELINKSIETSMKTPSICNRQPWEVIVIRKKEVLEQVLALQGGLTEQGENLSTLLVILTKNEYLMGPEERNQGYVDGGMFAMTLMYALHQNGLAVCPLNTDFNRQTDRKMRALLSINPHDCFIVMLSVGHYVENYKVPRSYRDDIAKVTTYIR